MRLDEASLSPRSHVVHTSVWPCWGERGCRQSPQPVALRSATMAASGR